MVEKAEGFAPGGHRQRVSARGQPCTVQIGIGGREFAVALHARAVVLDSYPVCRGGSRVVDVQVGAGVVDDPLAVALRVARIKIAVVGMPLEFLPGRVYAVEVADSLMVADEVDASVSGAGQPERGGQVAGQLAQKVLELSVSGAVDPEMAGSAPSIAFPAGRVAGVAPDHRSAFWPVGDRTCRPYWQRGCCTAWRLDGCGADRVFLRVKRAAVGRKQDVGSGCVPAEHLAAAVQVGQPLGAASNGRHQVDLWHSLFAADKGQPAAVGGKCRVIDLAQVAGQPPCQPSLSWDKPQIVFRDKNDGVAVNGGKTIVAVVHVVVCYPPEKKRLLSEWCCAGVPLGIGCQPHQQVKAHIVGCGEGLCCGKARPGKQTQRAFVVGGHGCPEQVGYKV